MTGLLPLLIAVGYICALFLIANQVEQGRMRAWQRQLRRPAYALALAVYCTSWTFFGSVGTAVADGVNYLPIYLGPLLIYFFAPHFLYRLIDAVQQEGATSISDFIGTRYGKSRSVSALVTIIALFGTVPYLALQLRSVGLSFAEIAGVNTARLPMVLTTILLALFAMLFGTRRFDVAARNDGLLFAVATESVVKLIAFLIAGGTALWVLYNTSAPQLAHGVARLTTIFQTHSAGSDFFVTMLISMAAIICLPRQFYIGVMEAQNPEDAYAAVRPFSAYLIAMTLILLPIVLGGLTLLPAQSRADLYILSLPLHAHYYGIGLIVFLGGFSAATAMVVVETVALSTMVSNDLIAPFILRGKRLSSDAGIGRMLLLVRRVVIAVMMSIALAYALLIPNSARLASIGLIAFAAMAQFAPALILAVRGRGQDPAAAKVAMSAGFILWFYTLLMPTLVDPATLLPLHGTLIDPYALLGVHRLPPLTHGVLWSLGVNVTLYALVAARGIRVPTFDFGAGMIRARPNSVRDLTGLADLVEKFVGKEPVSQVFGNLQESARPFTGAEARSAERLIASVIGAPSARAIMSAALSGSTLTVGAVTQLLDESAHSLQFSKGLLAATLEHIDPGVSVIDRNQNLVAWNKRYIDLFNYPEGMVKVGAPIGELIRFNLKRLGADSKRIEAQVDRRLGYMRAGSPHSFQRELPDGRVLKTVGGAMPDGGYVMCYTDVSVEANALTALQRARDELELRVKERTEQLEIANHALAGATQDKSRFLAAASHDLLQPIHAARLFVSGLAREVPERTLPLLDNVSRSIAAADKLLRTLLDISKLDAGGMTPDLSQVDVRHVITDLAESYALQAQERTLRLRAVGAHFSLETDQVLLLSILQNLVSNALRYTQTGGVLIAARLSKGRAMIEVYDTGVGIDEEHLKLIFREFERLGTVGEAGIGLGLAIVERIARVLDVEIEVRSVLGRGSRFRVIFPPSALSRDRAPDPAPAPPAPPAFGSAHRVSA